MPCYNTGKYISEAISSILYQSFPYFEFIIVNDGSTDETHTEIIKFVDNRIRYIKLDTNNGNYAARNIGMKVARGKYICVMDADDIAIPTRLEVQYCYMQKYKYIAAVGSQGRILNENGILTGSILSKPVCQPAQLKTLLLMDNFVLHPSLMFRSHLVKQHYLYYNEKYIYASDFDLIYRIASLFLLKNIKEPLIKYRFHSRQISCQYNRIQMKYADEIRLNQLNRFGIISSSDDILIYLAIMKRTPLNNSYQLKTALNILNKLLSRNRKLKLYNQEFLFQLFDYLLLLAQKKLLGKQ